MPTPSRQTRCGQSYRPASHQLRHRWLAWKQLSLVHYLVNKFHLSSLISNIDMEILPRSILSNSVSSATCHNFTELVSWTCNSTTYPDNMRRISSLILCIRKKFCKHLKRKEGGRFFTCEETPRDSDDPRPPSFFKSLKFLRGNAKNAKSANVMVIIPGYQCMPPIQWSSG